MSMRRVTLAVIINQSYDDQTGRKNRERVGTHSRQR